MGGGALLWGGRPNEAELAATRLGQLPSRVAWQLPKPSLRWAVGAFAWSAPGIAYSRLHLAQQQRQQQPSPGRAAFREARKAARMARSNTGRWPAPGRLAMKPMNLMLVRSAEWGSWKGRHELLSKCWYALTRHADCLAGIRR